MLQFFKYIGLAIASISSILGIVGDYKVKDANGKETGAISFNGKLAIIVTVLGLFVSAVANFIEDSEKKTSETKQLNTQIKNVLVDNYLMTEPENVEVAIKIPFKKEEAMSILDSSYFYVSWSSDYRIRDEWVSQFDFSGHIRMPKNAGEPRFILEDMSLGDKEKSLSPKEEKPTVKKGKFSNEKGIVYCNLIEGTNTSCYFVFPLTRGDYINEPWKRIIDFRNNDFCAGLELKGGRGIITNIARINKAKTNYLLFDHKYYLAMNNYNVTGQRVSEPFNDWNEFRSDIMSKLPDYSK